MLGKLSLVASSVLLLGLSSMPSNADVEVNADPAEWEEVVEAAKQEGKVVLYASNAPDQMDRLISGFEELYPEIEVEFLHIGGASMIARVDEEREGSLDGADTMLNSSMVWWTEEAMADRLLPMGPSAVGWPAEYMAEGNIPLVNLEPFGIVYNTQLVTTPPTGYADLLNPEYRGKIATTPPTGTASAMIYDFWTTQLGDDFLARLKEQEPRLYEGGDANAQGVASGEVWATMWGDKSGLLPLLEAGAPVAFVKPDPAIATQHFIAAFGWSKRPNAARLFVDYILSRDGQTALHGGGTVSASPRFDDIPDSLPRAGMEMVDTSAYSADRVREIREEFLNYFAP